MTLLLLLRMIGRSRCLALPRLCLTYSVVLLRVWKIVQHVVNARGEVVRGVITVSVKPALMVQSVAELEAASQEIKLVILLGSRTLRRNCLLLRLLVGAVVIEAGHWGAVVMIWGEPGREILLGSGRSRTLLPLPVACQVGNKPGDQSLGRFLCGAPGWRVWALWRQGCIPLRIASLTIGAAPELLAGPGRGPFQVRQPTLQIRQHAARHWRGGGAKGPET
mmetsp:Transcript_87608/g.203775  ORF Transcript_87608/g.203775 Transcript_87608/m.203775 type:complete len:221 (+) Transcript_87608:601-1263(+)